MPSDEQQDTRNLAAPVGHHVPPELQRPLERRDRLVVAARVRQRETDVLQHARHQPPRRRVPSTPLRERTRVLAPARAKGHAELVLPTSVVFTIELDVHDGHGSPPCAVRPTSHPQVASNAPTV